MNIVGMRGSQMVNFLHPSDYLFGDQKNLVGSEQGGIYHRSFVGIRIENVETEKIEKMHKYYLELQERAKTEKCNIIKKNQLISAQLQVIPW
jgi:hypothetical protein